LFVGLELFNFAHYQQCRSEYQQQQQWVNMIVLHNFAPFCPSRFYRSNYGISFGFVHWFVVCDSV